MTHPEQQPIPVAERLADVAFLARALADENRLRILVAVSGGPRSVTELVAATGLSQPLVSHHLRELKRALLVDALRRGPFVFYQVAHPDITAALDGLGRLAATLITARSGF